jgi:hypothetical protein
MKEYILTTLVFVAVYYTFNLGTPLFHNEISWQALVGFVCGICVTGTLLSLRDKEVIRKFCRKLLQEDKG